MGNTRVDYSNSVVLTKKLTFIDTWINILEDKNSTEYFPDSLRPRDKSLF